MVSLLSKEELDKFKCPEAKCREKTLEMSGLEPTAPNRLADRKHCAFGAVGSSPDFSRVFSRHLASGHLNLTSSSHVLQCHTQADTSHFN